MKRYIYIAFALLTFTSCDYKEKELFSKKPSERSVEVLQTYKDLLETPDTYWVLTSYPGVIIQLFGHTHIILLFLQLNETILATHVA